MLLNFTLHCLVDLPPHKRKSHGIVCYPCKTGQNMSQHSAICTISLSMIHQEVEEHRYECDTNFEDRQSLGRGCCSLPEAWLPSSTLQEPPRLALARPLEDQICRSMFSLPPHLAQETTTTCNNVALTMEFSRFTNVSLRSRAGLYSLLPLGIQS